jgi:hypothetical protein
MKGTLTCVCRNTSMEGGGEAQSRASESLPTAGASRKQSCSVWMKRSRIEETEGIEKPWSARIAGTRRRTSNAASNSEARRGFSLGHVRKPTPTRSQSGWLG